MQQYDVFALGNALVDFEFKVDDNFLKEFSIDKGHMTLIDEKRLEEIQNGLNSPTHKKQSGGSAANTIIALSQLGGSGFYSCKVAGDEDGAFYLKDLKGNGVDHKSRIESLPDDITGKCIVMVTPDAQRSMNTYLGVTGRFSQSELDLEALERAKYLYIEGYLVTNPDAMIAIDIAVKAAKKIGAKIALTLSDPGIVAHFREQFNQILSYGIDLLFSNEEEALSITESENLDQALSKLGDLTKTFVVTRGASGAIISNLAEQARVEGFEVDAIDTNGAGDMFAGAYMHGLINGKSAKESGQLACYLSSKIVSQFGPRLTKDEVHKSVKEFEALDLK